MSILNGTVMWLTFRQLFVRKRLFAAIALALLPALITLLFRNHQSRSGVPSAVFLSQMYVAFVIGVLLPLAAVLFGTGAFGLDLDEGTLVYLLVKPLPRWQLVLSRYVVAVLSTVAVMLPSVLLPWLILGVGTVTFRMLAAICAGMGIGALLYAALFIPLGIVSKRALVIGLLYIVVLEELISRAFAGARSLSVREYATAVAKAVGHGAETISAPTVSLTTAWVMGTIVLVGGLTIAIRKLARFEAEERL